jgi:hypothetical protein
MDSEHGVPAVNNMRTIVVDGNFILIICGYDGQDLYSLGHKFEFGLFQDHSVSADTVEEAIDYVRDFGEWHLSESSTSIRCFELIRAFLAESDDLSEALEALSAAVNSLRYELFSDELIFEKSLLPGHPVVFEQIRASPKFQMIVGNKCYEYWFGSSTDSKDLHNRYMSLCPTISDFCITQLCSFYEKNKTRSHLLKYRDLKLGADLGL